MIAKIGHMYYHRQLSQIEIGEKLGLSRFKVSRLLKQGMEDGIIAVQIHEPGSYHQALADELEVVFELRSALIVDEGDLEEEELKRQVAIAAGRFLIMLLGAGDVLGVSLGTTIQEMVASLHIRARQGVTVVQLIGGGPESANGTSCDALTRQLANKLRTEPHFLYAPALVDNIEIKAALISDSHIQATYLHYKSLSIAVVGIGALAHNPRSRLVEKGIIAPKTLQDLVDRGAVGDILHFTFDIHGRLVISELEGRVIGIPLEDLMATPLRIGVAAGIHKADAILGGLRGGFINILVTDYRTALALLDQEKETNPLVRHRTGKKLTVA